MNGDAIFPGDADIRTYGVPINQANRSARGLDRARKSALGPLGDVRRRIMLAPEGMHPFKVYLAQLAFSDFSNPTADTTTWWRTFLVRGGEINNDPMISDGCDSYDADPYSDYFPLETVNDSSGQPLKPFTVPADTDPFYVWAELTQTNPPALRWGTNPATTAAPVVNPWANWPAEDGVHFLIATIDTGTNNAAFGPAIIRQYLTADIPPGLLIGGCDQTGAPLSVYLPYAYVQTPPK